MATKTISIDLSAYDRLASARQNPKESFSEVIKRAEWLHAPATGASLLELISRGPLIPDSLRRELDQAQFADKPPLDKWH